MDRSLCECETMLSDGFYVITKSTTNEMNDDGFQSLGFKACCLNFVTDGT